ncbi:MAG: PLP-dependent aspartate aminotransferase family protein [Phycisphaerales bacterium]
MERFTDSIGSPSDVATDAGSGAAPHVAIDMAIDAGIHPSDPRLICPSIGRGHGDGAPLLAPIVQSSTFVRDGVGSDPDHQYSRVSNPTVATLEAALGALEDAPPAACFTTGLAAESALFLALLRAGDHVICGRAVYGGTTRLLQQLLPDLGVACTFVDSHDATQIADALRPETRLVFVETPSNPTLELTDIAACRAALDGHDALLAVDNTFLTAALQRPLDLGADISVYSTTKFIDGHSIALGGAIVARDEAVLDRIRFIRKCTGAIQTPFDAWLTINGLKTLPLRLAAQSAAAAEIATWLAGQAGVRVVHHPSRADAKNRAIAARQHPAGDGAVVSFEVDGDVAGGTRFVSALTRCTLVEHVGSVETLITHPASMTHADVPADEREAAGIAGGLLRLSVGLEPVESIVADLQRGLDAASAASVEGKAIEPGGTPGAAGDRAADASVTAASGTAFSEAASSGTASPGTPGRATASASASTAKEVEPCLARA